MDTKGSRRQGILIVGMGMCVLAAAAHGAIPMELNHQGMVKADGVAFDGVGEFRFALVDGTSLVNVWTNDGTQLDTANMPGTAVTVVVSEGVYSVQLGGSSMVAIPQTVFDTGNLLLRVWFDDNVHGVQRLVPDQPMTSVPFTVRAAVADSADDADMVDGLDSADFAAVAHSHALQNLSGAVTDAQVPDDITVDHAANADTVDGHDASAFSPATHGHNLQDLSGAVTDAQVPDDITVDHAGTARDADTVDGLEADAFMSASADAWVDETGDAMSGSLTVEASRDLQAVPANAAVLVGSNTATGHGVYGGTDSNRFGAGVYGEATDTVGDNTTYGGYFVANSESGTGVLGWAKHESGGIGGSFTSSADSGTGVYGRAVGSGMPRNYGGYFVANGGGGRGVYASATGTYELIINYGGYLEAASPTGRGVYGAATYTGESTNYGGEFEAASETGVGVRGHASHTGAFTNIGGLFSAEGDTGVGVRALGGDSGYDFYAYGPGANYGPFTGAHEVKLAEGVPEGVEGGVIVCVTGETQVRRDSQGAVNLSSTLPTVALADTPNDAAVLGVLVAETPLMSDHWYTASEGERFGIVNALGEGRVWVTDANGRVAPGDYVTTSAIPGYGQRQADDLLHSYTLGKVTEAVDWDAVTETVEYNGVSHRAYLVAVVYTSG